jgi:hypothetical protein
VGCCDAQATPRFSLHAYLVYQLNQDCDFPTPACTTLRCPFEWTTLCIRRLSQLQPFCCSCPQTMMAVPDGIRRNCTLLRLRMSDFCWRQRRLPSIRGMYAAQTLVSPRPRLLVFGLTLDGRSIAVRESIHFPRWGVSTTSGDAVKRQSDGLEGSSQTLRVTHVIAVFSRSALQHGIQWCFPCVDSALTLYKLGVAAVVSHQIRVQCM